MKDSISANTNGCKAFGVPLRALLVHSCVIALLAAPVAGAEPNKRTLSPAVVTAGALTSAEMGSTSAENRVYAANAAVETSVNHDVMLHWLAAQRTTSGEQVACVTEHLGHAKRLADAVANASDAMNEALAEVDGELARHELRKIGVALTRSRQMRAEADQCINGATPEKALHRGPEPTVTQTDPTEAPPARLWWFEL